MKKACAIVLLFVSCSLRAQFYSATSAGGNTGADCSDAYAYNDGAHGLGVAKTWTPGATLHLCGTFTETAGQTLITSQASGTSGSPITLKFETGAVLTAPYWGGSDAGAININKNYIIVDGGTNGTIENTANGTSLTYQQTSIGVFVGYTTTNVELKNLSVLNMYIRSGTGGDGANVYGLRALDAGGGNSNLSIHNNTITHARAGIIDTYGTSSNVKIYSNTISGIVWGINVGSNGSGPYTMSGLSIYSNSISGFGEWANTADTLHMDGVFVYANSSAGSVANPLIYNNSVRTDFPSGNGTAAIYYGGWVNGANTFNNVLACVGGADPMDGYIFGVAGSNLASYNNTIVGCGLGLGIGMYYASTSGVPTTNVTNQNNLIENVQIGVWLDTSSTFAGSSNNLYYSTGTWYVGRLGSSYYSSLAAWRAACSCDANSLTSNPALSGSYTLTVGSPAIQSGTNLTSLGITALDLDAAGAVRPATGAWDIGAHQHLLLGPPTGLRDLVK